MAMEAMNMVAAGGFSGVSYHLRRCPQGLASVLRQKTTTFGSRQSKLDHLTVPHKIVLSFQPRPLILSELLRDFQRAIAAPVHCPLPVIAAVHGACVGAGFDLITSADVRLCSADAWFQVKEVDVGLAADVGTLARLTKVVGSESWAREIAFTARRVGADEALSRGLVSQVLPSREALMKVRIRQTVFSRAIAPPDHLLLDRPHNIEPLISRWELDKFKYC
jgi:hypothetical protein